MWCWDFYVLYSSIGDDEFSGYALYHHTLIYKMILKSPTRVSNWSWEKECFFLQNALQLLTRSKHCLSQCPGLCYKGKAIIGFCYVNTSFNIKIWLWIIVLWSRCSIWPSSFLLVSHFSKLWYSWIAFAYGTDKLFHHVSVGLRKLKHYFFIDFTWWNVSR